MPIDLIIHRVNSVWFYLYSLIHLILVKITVVKKDILIKPLELKGTFTRFKIYIFVKIYQEKRFWECALILGIPLYISDQIISLVYKN